MHQCKTHSNKSHGGPVQIIVAIAHSPPSFLLVWNEAFYFSSYPSLLGREGKDSQRKERQKKKKRLRTAAHGPCWLATLFLPSLCVFLLCSLAKETGKGTSPFFSWEQFHFFWLDRVPRAWKHVFTWFSLLLLLEPWRGVEQRWLMTLTDYYTSYTLQYIGYPALFICSRGFLSIGSIVHLKGHQAHFSRVKGKERNSERERKSEWMKGMIRPLVQDLPKSTKKIHHTNVSPNQHTMDEPDYVAINLLMPSHIRWLLHNDLALARKKKERKKKSRAHNDIEN